MVAILPGITPPWVIMLQAEKDELDARLSQLSKVVQQKEFASVGEGMQYLMTAQLFAMQTYSAVLGARLSIATKQVPASSNEVN